MTVHLASPHPLLAPAALLSPLLFRAAAASCVPLFCLPLIVIQSLSHCNDPNAAMLWQVASLLDAM
jgi:hypothetical protein